jgi:hypothetical protein
MENLILSEIGMEEKIINHVGGNRYLLIIESATNYGGGFR